MKCPYRTYILILPLMALFCTACNLKITKVKSQDISCLFDKSCRVTVHDTSSAIPLPASGTMFLQSRTYQGSKGSEAEGIYAYEYRIDLRDGIGITYIPCITSMRITFTPIHAGLDYDKDGSPDQIFVVTKGGMGNIAISSAEKKGDTITFTFETPVCVGGQAGKGDSTYFFGLTSPRPPSITKATLKGLQDESYEVEVRSAIP